jgi:DNA/RNA endonuclease YhcR with UshA esterase domain
MICLKKVFQLRRVGTAVLLATLPLSAAAAPIRPDEAELYAGRIASVEGIAHVSKPNTGTVTFIEVNVPGNAATVTGIVMSGDEPKFPNLMEYEGKKVDIAGALTHFKGTLRIVLIKSEQLKLVP